MTGREVGRSRPAAALTLQDGERVPGTLTILDVIMFLRLNQVVAQAGLLLMCNAGDVVLEA